MLQGPKIEAGGQSKIQNWLMADRQAQLQKIIQIKACGKIYLWFVQVSYCEEKVDCRRVMIMGHFGEKAFTERLCHKTCDNCQNAAGAEHETRDVTEARPLSILKSCIYHESSCASTKITDRVVHS